MFKSQVGLSVKVTQQDHPRFGTAGINTGFQVEGSDQVLIKFDADGVEEMTDVSALQVL